MLFSDSIKDHWLCKIEEVGNRFDPDCGSSPPREDGKAAPLHLLTGLYDNDCPWKKLFREFQLPRWILECIDNHMHNISLGQVKETFIELLITVQLIQTLKT